MGEQRLRGLPASPGVAVGPVWWYRRSELRVTRQIAEDPEAERNRLRLAREESAAELEALIAARRDRLSPEELAIFEAQRLMLDDPDLLARVEAAIGSGAAAEAAWEEAKRCFNCGVCMDVCPFDALDMTRPKFLGPESRFDRHAAQPQPAKPGLPPGWLFVLAPHLRASPGSTQGC